MRTAAPPNLTFAFMRGEREPRRRTTSSVSTFGLGRIGERGDEITSSSSSPLSSSESISSPSPIAPSGCNFGTSIVSGGQCSELPLHSRVPPPPRPPFSPLFLVTTKSIRSERSRYAWICSMNVALRFFSTRSSSIKYTLRRRPRTSINSDETRRIGSVPICSVFPMCSKFQPLIFSTPLRCIPTIV